MNRIIYLVLAPLLFFACSGMQSPGTVNVELPEGSQLATFAGGCFWCIESGFEGIDGVYSVTSGYSGGEEVDPTYDQVSSGKTGHRESVQVVFDPKTISYAELVDIFWKQFDPTDEGGSFYDRGTQYRSAIFYHSEEQKKIAQESKDRLSMSGTFDKTVYTPLIEYNKFWPAEEYHQDYFKKEPEHYHSYRKGSGRDDFIRAHWEIPDAKKYPRPTDEELKKKLTDIQYQVTVHNGTERPFDNPYFDKKEDGIYVCIVSGAPLFSSGDKFDSGTGWPSFTKPIDARWLVKVVDKSGGDTRVEVRSKFGDSHLGHVFYDGPGPGHLRYCMDSAALRFISKDKMKKEGYGAYLWLLD